MTKPVIALLVGLLGAASTAHAQHTPLIERMAEPSPVATPAPTAAPVIQTNSDSGRPAAAGYAAARPARTQVGDSTRALLRLQAEGSSAGNALPMLGEAASRSYQRYLNSFDHPIPEYFETTVPTSSTAGSSR